MAKQSNRETITNLPPTGETGAGAPEYGRQDVTGGSIRPPQYREESFFQKLRDNWIIIAFFLTLFWGFVTQVWTPLIELKQRVGVLEKSADKQDSLIEQIRTNMIHQNFSFPSMSPTVTPQTGN